MLQQLRKRVLREASCLLIKCTSNIDILNHEASPQSVGFRVTGLFGAHTRAIDSIQARHVVRGLLSETIRGCVEAVYMTNNKSVKGSLIPLSKSSVS